MSRAYPCLYIRSYGEAVRFYVDFLGFKIDFEWRHEEGFPVYMGVSRGESPGITEGELALHLTEHKEVPESNSILMDVEDVHALHNDLMTRGPDVLETAASTHHGADLVDQAWGKTDLHLVDPFGNSLAFSSPTKPSRG